MQESREALAERLLGKGMVLGPELDQINPSTKLRDIQFAYDDFLDNYRYRQSRAAKRPLAISQTYLFHGPSTRECGRQGRRLENARPEFNLLEEKVYTLTLEKCLAGGTGRWSQAWLCGLTGNGVPEGIKVVFKLYQASQFPVPEEGHFNIHTAYFGKLMEPAQNYARREASAYQYMAEQQGCLIPYCYGFHQFTLPNKEIAEGVILEYINGAFCVDHIVKQANQIPVQLDQLSLVEPLYLRIFEDGNKFLTRYSVVHRDSGRGNILITGTHYKTGNWDLVYLDFGQSLTPDTVAPQQALEQHQNQLLEGLMDAFTNLLDTNVKRALRKSLIQQMP